MGEGVAQQPQQLYYGQAEGGATPSSAPQQAWAAAPDAPAASWQLPASADPTASQGGDGFATPQGSVTTSLGAPLPYADRAEVQSWIHARSMELEDMQRQFLASPHSVQGAAAAAAGGQQ